jgi:hypothetical protein
MFTFNRPYFLLSLLIFIIEVLIALFVRDNFIRPYLGDTLVVILIYCFIKSFLDTPVFSTALFTLAFSFLVEFLQYLDIVDKLQIKSEILKTVLGTSFAWNDILAYVAGFAIILSVEKFKQ